MKNLWNEAAYLFCNTKSIPFWRSIMIITWNVCIWGTLRHSPGSKRSPQKNKIDDEIYFQVGRRRTRSTQAFQRKPQFVGERKIKDYA